MDASPLVAKFTNLIINPIIQVVFAAGLFLFLWGLVVFLWNLNEGGEDKGGKQHMLWGIIGMFIMASVYGIISFLNTSFGLQAGNPDVSRINNVTLPANFGGGQ
jgi:hypothetical protein